jgi:glycosyltransferase involved in cell wall biosynthesis
VSGAPEYRPCVIIPVYEHGATVGSVIGGLGAAGELPVILVDDGSGAGTKRSLARLAAERPGVTLVTHARNRGKGAAVLRGIETARGLGFSHALQVDADGQHDLSRALFFLERAAARPEAVVCGLPRFDTSAPALRRRGREISNTWGKIVTLSDSLPDLLCGFRVYPVETTLEAARRHPIDKRMGFDAEILVRLYWKNIPIIFYPVNVTYPRDGISHYRVVRDNLRISLMFARLFLGMLCRFPSLLARGKK